MNPKQLLSASAGEKHLDDRRRQDHLRERTRADAHDGVRNRVDRRDAGPQGGIGQTKQSQSEAGIGAAQPHDLIRGRRRIEIERQQAADDGRKNADLVQPLLEVRECTPLERVHRPGATSYVKGAEKEFRRTGARAIDAEPERQKRRRRFTFTMNARVKRPGTPVVVASSSRRCRAPRWRRQTARCPAVFPTYSPSLIRVASWPALSSM